MAGRLTDEERADRQMTEAALNARVTYRLKKYGWVVQRLQRTGLGVGDDGAVVHRTIGVVGWPDLVCLRADRRPLAIELKRELGKLSDEQVEMLTLMKATGIDVAVIRPSDLRLGRVEAALR